jgi:hypothetical protein
VISGRELQGGRQDANYRALLIYICVGFIAAILPQAAYAQLSGDPRDAILKARGTIIGNWDTLSEGRGSFAAICHTSEGECSVTDQLPIMPRASCYCKKSNQSVAGFVK